MTIPKIVDFRGITMESGVSSINQGAGFVKVRVSCSDDVSVIGTITVEDARQIGHQFLEVAEAAVSDAAVYGLLTNEVGADENLAGHLVVELRRYRSDMKESDG